MSTTEDDKRGPVPVVGRSRAESSLTFLRFGIGAFAAYHLALALFMTVGPHAFFKELGPFGTFNSHYIRDLATYNAAVGVALVVALKHLVDVNDAHPAWTGYLDLVTLVVTTLVLSWLLRVAIRLGRSD
jgi:hypothetical protein